MTPARASSRLSGLHGPLLLSLVPGLVLSLVYEWQSRGLAGGPGFPLDDAWIHGQFARNIAEGRGFSYTGTDWVAGSTAPLWTLVLAAGYRLLPDIVLVAKAIGLALQLATGYLAGRLAFGVAASVAVACATAGAVAVTPIMAWGAMSGMEVPLAALLVIGALALYGAPAEPSAARGLGAVALLAAGFSVRPEIASMAGLLAAHYTVFGRSPAGWLRRALLCLMVAGLMVAPTVWLSEVTIGRPLPTTFYAKSGPGILRAIEARDTEMARKDLIVWGPKALTEFVRTARLELGWAAWLAPVGLVGCAMRGRWRFAVLLAAVLVVVPYSMGLLAPQRLKPDNVRYVGQLVVIVAALAGLALAPLAQLPRGAWIAWAGAAAVVAVVGLQAWHGAPVFARSVANIEGLHVTLARWVRQHVPSGSVLAANDVGALAYFGGHRILDIEGLVTPAALAYRSAPSRGLRFITDQRPDFVVIFDSWYPEIRKNPAFVEIHRQTHDDAIVAAGRTLVVYRTPWTRVPAF